MADNPEFTDVLEKETQDVVGNIIQEQDWEEEDKQRILKEYMAEFDVVLREMMPMMVAFWSGKKPTASENKDDEEEKAKALEEAKVRYEVTAIATTKRRRTYPEYLSKLLGKTTRLKKNTASVMKVDVPLSEPMKDVEVTDAEDSYLDVLKKEVNDSLLESTHSILTDVERLSGLLEFAKVTKQTDPLSSIFADYGATKS